MEYLEIIMETLVLEILICWKRLVRGTKFAGRALRVWATVQWLQRIARGGIFIRHMLTSSNGNIFRGPRWIPRTKVSDAELWCFSFIYVGTNGWVNNSKAGDLKRYRAHYDVIVMKWNDGIPNQCDSNGLKKSICVWHGNNSCLNVDWYIACQLNWYTFRDMQKYCQRHHSQNQSYIDIFVSHSI